MIHCQALQWGATGQPLTPPLDLELPVGSLTAVIGHNGCGKSSLLKVLAGLQKPLAGRVRVSAQGLGQVVYLQQQQSIDRQFPLRLQQLVSAGLWRSKLPRQLQQQRLQQALADWHLTDLAERPLQALSGGELQRALLARLNLTEASLLLLDEPEAALDEQGQQLFWQHVQRWQAAGRTLLLVSHNLSGLTQRVDNALLVSRHGCIFAPLRQVLSQRATLEQVA
ncbi:MAG: ATP-binding cassette domain-containing protein [Pseudomonadaceae bacterium]|nr:ATP-binding cassette domain-containing protein [Pseudomonadaceae bacterium]